MASYILLCLLLSTSFFFLPISQASNTRSLNQYVLPIVKDIYKNQYYTSFEIGTPPIRVYLIIDLGNHFSWMTCQLYGYNTSTSSTMHEHSCHSALCATYGESHRPWCYGTDLCGVYAYTPWTLLGYACGVYEDTISLYTKISKVSKISLPHFAIACPDTEPLKGISKYTKGIATFARTGFGLPLQVSSTLGIPTKFALCIPSSTKGLNGVIYFGGGPYILHPSVLDFTKVLITTPLVINPFPPDSSHISGLGDPSYDYYINVRSIKINKVPVRFNFSLLSIDYKTANGGMKISTMHPYTALHTDIYNAFVETFARQAEAMDISRVPAVAPFGACFSVRGITTTAMGLAVPIIDFVFDGSKSAQWRIYGANSMVKVGRNVTCLAFVDGGSSSWNFPMTSIIMGGYQLENNLVEFDLESNKFGISFSLLRWNTTCSQLEGF